MEKVYSTCNGYSHTGQGIVSMGYHFHINKDERKKEESTASSALFAAFLIRPSFSPSSFSFYFFFLYFCVNILTSNHFFRLLAVAPHKNFFSPPHPTLSTIFILLLLLSISILFAGIKHPPHPPPHSFPGKNLRSKGDKFQNAVLHDCSA